MIAVGCSFFACRFKIRCVMVRSVVVCDFSLYLDYRHECFTSMMIRPSGTKELMPS